MSTCIKRYDTYTPSCVSAPVTENWTAPLAYAMKAILQRNEPHAVFGMPLSAAVGIYVEKINPLTVTDDNTTFETVQGDASLQVEAFAFVEPFTVAPIRLRPVMTASFLDSLLAIDPSVTLTDDGIKQALLDVPRCLCEDPEAISNPSKVSNVFLNTNAKRQSFAFVRDHFLHLSGTLEMAKLLRACVVVDNFAAAFAMQPSS